MRNDEETVASVETLSVSGPAYSRSPRPSEGGETERQLARPEEDDAFTKRLVKQKLFPRRAAPVKIGRFAVLSRLGGGGMGLVYACYDDRLDRKVAVKVLRSEISRDPVLARARLLREAQAMARLAHPNIVMVHEVGEVGDEVFVAMEFVRGPSLDVWVEQAPRPWRQVVAVYVQAGRGLVAAHRGGIIHRDFKPQNVLVSEDGLVKVLDFGLARATDGLPGDDVLLESDSAERSNSAGHLMHPLTRTGVVMGTPAYMAPEQHLGEETTAASDQFSFCVSLYQSLYGRLPFSTASLAALRLEALQGTIAAPPPGTPVPARVFKVLRRGMAVAPAARFPSMAALLAELERVTGVRRRAALVVGAAALVAASGLAAAALQAPAAVETCPDAQVELAGIWDEARAETVRSLVLAIDTPYAVEAWTTIEPQLVRYAAQWVALRNEACQTHAEARQSDQLFDLRTACLDQHRAGFAGVIDVLASTDAATLPGAVQAVAKLPGLDRCADAEALTAALPPPEDPRARARVQRLRETLARAEAQEDAGRYAEGIDQVESMLPEVAALSYEPLRAEALLRLGSLEMEAGDLVSADAALEQSLWAALAIDHAPVAAQASSKRVFLRAARSGHSVQALAELPWARALNQRVVDDVELYAEFLNNAGVVYALGGQPAEARKSLQAALDLRERHGQGSTLKQVGTLNNLGYLALLEGRAAEAVALARRTSALSQAVLGEQHPVRVGHVLTLARGLLSIGRPNEARALVEPLEPTLDAIGKLQALHALGEAALMERDLVGARRSFETALEMCPADFAFADEILRELGRALALQGDEAAIRERFAAALAELAAKGGADAQRYRVMEVYYGRALGGLGRLAEARAMIEPALSRCEAGQGGRVLDCAWVRRSLGEAQQRAGEAAAAERTLAQALVGYEEALPPQSLDIAELYRALGELALARADATTAQLRLERAVSIYTALVEPDYPPLASARLSLARALSSSAGPATPDARALAEQALASFTAKGPAFAPEQAAASAWLEEHR